LAVLKRIRSSIKRYFITGLLVITPIWGTYLILKALLVTLEGVLGQVLRRYASFYIPGLGIVVLALLILLAGVLATNIFGKKIVQFWDYLLNRVPVVRGIYSVLKAIVDAISLQSKGHFNRVVLVQYPRNGIYSLAFVTGVTQGEAQMVTRDKLVSIFVPTTPNPTSGFFIMVPQEDVIPLSMSIDEGMKMIITAGFFTPPAPETVRPAPGTAESGGSA
jgi:uncharacterized membrane protein